MILIQHWPHSALLLMVATGLLLPVISTSLEKKGKRLFTPEEFLGFKSVSDAQISPDGSHVAFVLGDVYKAQSKDPQSRIWIVSTDGTGLRPLTSGPRTDVLPRWSPGGSTLAFASDRLEDGQKQIYLLPVDGGEALAITDIKGTVPTPRGLNSLQWSPDGRFLAFLKEDAQTLEEKFKAEQKDDAIEFEKNPKYVRLWVIEIASQSVHCASPEGLQVWEFGWSSDSKNIVATVSDVPYEWAWYSNRLVRFPTTGGAAQNLYQSHRQVALPRWSPDGKKIAFLSSFWSDRGVTAGDIFVLDSGGGEARDVTEGAEASFGWIEWSEDSQSLIAVSHEGGGMSFSEISSQTGERERLWWGEVAFAESHWPRFSVAFPHSGKAGPKESGTAFPTETTIAVVREDGTHPRDVWTLSRSARVLPAKPAEPTHTQDRLVSPKGSQARYHWKQLTQLHPRLTDLAIPSAESIHWKGAEGWNLQGILVKPIGYQAGEKYPMVTWVHGGPTSASTFRYPSDGYVQSLAARGMAVFLPNYRGSVGRGLQFAEANIGDLGGKDFQDIMLGIDYCIQLGIADSNKLGIGGWSYGGFMTAWAVSQTTRFKAAVMGAGISNWLSFHGNSVLADWDAKHYNADPYEKEGVYQRFSAINYAERIKTPTLILHGEKDGDVPPEQSYQFFRALKDHKIETELVIYPREGHGPNEKMHLLDLACRIPGWFEKYLIKCP
jgi:dipeptidyl aminopeptidase/acylaminoacyl peptidase